MPNVHAAEDRPAHRGRVSSSAPPAIRSQGAARYYARIAFLYDGTQLARGQVFTLAGARNDEKLIRLRYVAAVEERHETYTCPDCGAEFITSPDREGHARRCLQRQRTLAGQDDPYEEDAHTEAEDKRILGELALDQTAASLR